MKPRIEVWGTEGPARHLKPSAQFFADVVARNALR
jgi:hypothetical protein